MLGACDLLSAQRAKKNASVIVDYKVDQAARKQGLAQAGMAVANYTAQLRAARALKWMILRQMAQATHGAGAVNQQALRANIAQLGQSAD